MLGIQLASLPREGGPGPTFTPAGSCALTIASVAYARAGTLLRPGDVVALDRMSPADRVLATHDSSSVGDTVSMVVLRGGRASRLIESVTAPEPASYWAPSVAVKVITFLVGLLLLWRGRDVASLHYGVASAFFAIAVLPISDALLSPGQRNLYEALAQIFAGVAAYALYLTFEDLARGAIRERILTACRAAVGICSLLFIANAIGFSIGRSMNGCFVPVLYVVRYPALMIALAVMIGVLTTTFVKATGLQRQRVRWVFWSTIVGFSGVVTWLIVPSLRAAVLTSVVITIGYAYAILRHRIIDVGFVINRAIVFTTVTTAVFAIFALVSTFVERLTLPSDEGVIVQSVVALALAFSFDFGFKRVESIIDRVFFRDKHKAEVALRKFTDEARFSPSAPVLLERALRVVCESLRASAACFYREHLDGYRNVAASGSGRFPETVSGDDPAFARLRARLKDVDLGETKGALAGDGYGFALAAQSRLMGALIVRSRSDAEAFDPEERELVRALAREVASALQAISASDHVAFLELLATGKIDGDAAREQARALIARES
jgi:hypothetical protein